MPTMMIRHKVKDFDAWKPAYEEHQAIRDEYGIHEVSLHRDAEDPNEVVVVLEAENLDKAHEFAQADELRSAMEKAGVISEPMVWFLDDVK